MAKAPYENPSFMAAPIAVICSKSGCPVREQSLMEENAFKNEPSLGEKAVPSLPEDINSRADQDRLFIFEPALQQVYSLNATGASIVSNIDGVKNIGEISKIMENKFSKTPDNLNYEVASFINALRNAGLRIEMK